MQQNRDNNAIVRHEALRYCRVNAQFARAKGILTLSALNPQPVICDRVPYVNSLDPDETRSSLASPKVPRYLPLG